MSGCFPFVFVFFIFTCIAGYHATSDNDINKSEQYAQKKIQKNIIEEVK